MFNKFATWNFLLDSHLQLSEGIYGEFVLVDGGRKAGPLFPEPKSMEKETQKNLVRGTKFLSILVYWNQ